MKYIYIIMLLNFYALSTHGQNFIYVEGKKYSGYIVGKEYLVFKSVKDQANRYTPSIEDIKNAETLLLCRITDKKHQESDSIVIDCSITKNLSKYLRQYVGFIDKSGDHIIWMNFIYKKTNHPTIDRDVIQPQDGGNYYWSVYINLDKNSLFDMKLNGPG